MSFNVLRCIVAGSALAVAPLGAHAQEPPAPAPAGTPADTAAPAADTTPAPAAPADTPAPAEPAPAPAADGKVPARAQDATTPVTAAQAVEPPAQIAQVEKKAPSPNPYELHAYARGGLAVNGEGGYQQVFQLAGTDRFYRLGNKDDFYLEISYDHRWIAEDEIELGTRFMVSYWGHNIGSDPFDGEAVHFREGYAWLSRVVSAMPELRVWAGQRYYGREYIPQIDLFYSSSEGVGGGVENIDVGIGKLAVGYLGATKTVIEAMDMEVAEYSRGRMVKSSLDVRLTDIALPLGSLKVWGNVAYVPGGRIDELDMEFDALWGVLAGAEWTTPMGSLKGDNHLGVVYKRGLNNFREFPDSSFVRNGQGGPGDYTNLDEFEPKSFRVLAADWFAIQPHAKFSLLGTGLVRLLDHGDGTGRNYWMSVGLQPMYYYAKRLAVGVEGSVDYVIDEERDVNGHLAKLTLVQKVLASPNWWANPSVQFFVTLAQWDRDVGLAWSWSANGHGVSYQPPETQDTVGLSAGAMFETYF